MKNMSLSQRKVTVTFTYKQARALVIAASEVLAWEDATDAAFNGDKSEIQAGDAAWQKLIEAANEVQRNFLPDTAPYREAE